MVDAWGATATPDLVAPSETRERYIDALRHADGHDYCSPGHVRLPPK